MAQRTLEADLVAIGAIYATAERPFFTEIAEPTYPLIPDEIITASVTLRWKIR